LKAVLATRNRHKAAEIARLLPDVELVTLDDVAPDVDLPEPHDSFRANAISKARAVVAATGQAAIADDSGLEVDALDGRPGVRSARYAGARASDEDNNRKLVAELRDVPEHRRAARYRCVAVMVAPDGTEVVTEGVCEGHVVLEGRGTGGFGYDPHFVPAGETSTMAEMSTEAKSALSHRGSAFRALRERLAEPS